MSGIQRSRKPAKKKIFVGNLNFDTTKREIEQLFNKHGKVKNIELPSDWETGHSRGFAFVEMVNVDEAERAVSALDGVKLENRPLTVRVASPELPVGFKSLCLDQSN